MTIRIGKTRRINKSRKVLSQYRDQVAKIVVAGANDVKNTAVRNINAHGSSGRTYGRHTASAPYKYPNTDTGNLVKNIFVDVAADRLSASVESRAAYSMFLEFGTKDMIERPFLQPALEENRDKIIRAYAKLRARTK